MLEPTPPPAPMHHEDGSVSFKTPQGATITTHADGRVDLNVQHHYCPIKTHSKSSCESSVRSGSVERADLTNS